jgi:hypothetical protein
MCLRNIRKIKVRKPITVYKVEQREFDKYTNSFIWLSPCQSAKLDKNVINIALGKLGIETISDHKKIFFSRKNKRLHGGAFHTFKNKEDAIKGIFFLINNGNTTLKDFRVIKCIIPLKC